MDQGHDSRPGHPPHARVGHQFPFPVIFIVAANLQMVGIARLARLLRLTRFAAVMTLAGKTVTRIFSKRGLAYIVVITLIVAVGFGVLYGLIEEQGSISDGIWWALMTITTVGYGDFFPVTTAGRIVGGLLMVVGIGFVATLTASVAAHFMDDADSHLSDQYGSTTRRRSDIAHSARRHAGCPRATRYP